MPASMQSVTTRGFGNGTYNGTSSLVVSMGYGLTSPLTSSAFRAAFVQIPGMQQARVQIPGMAAASVQCPGFQQASIHA